jgi:hypothetical protein
MIPETEASASRRTGQPFGLVIEASPRIGYPGSVSAPQPGRSGWIHTALDHRRNQKLLSSTAQHHPLAAPRRQEGKPMAAQPVETGIQNLADLQHGQKLEARRNTTQYRGRVDQTAPELRVLWIREEFTHERKLLHLDDYTLWLQPE